MAIEPKFHPMYPLENLGFRKDQIEPFTRNLKMILALHPSDHDRFFILDEAVHRAWAQINPGRVLNITQRREVCRNFGRMCRAFGYHVDERRSFRGQLCVKVWRTPEASRRATLLHRLELQQYCDKIEL